MTLFTWNMTIIDNRLHPWPTLYLSWKRMHSSTVAMPYLQPLLDSCCPTVSYIAYMPHICYLWPASHWQIWVWRHSQNGKYITSHHNVVRVHVETRRQVTCQANLMKFGHLVTEICSRTDIPTERHAVCNTLHPCRCKVNNFSADCCDGRCGDGSTTFNVHLVWFCLVTLEFTRVNRALQQLMSISI